MQISFVLLLITCFFYGASLLIKEWDDFWLKLINTLAIIAIIVLSFITVDPEDGILGYSDYWWLTYIFPAGAVLLGNFVGEAIHDDDGDWYMVFLCLAGLGLIATIVTTCCGL